MVPAVLAVGVTSDARPGDRVEVGRQRDDAWAALLDRLPAGSVAVAVDYGHTVADRPREGTLVAYREGASSTRYRTGAAT